MEDEAWLAKAVQAAGAGGRRPAAVTGLRGGARRLLRGLGSVSPLRSASARRAVLRLRRIRSLWLGCPRGGFQKRLAPLRLTLIGFDPFVIGGPSCARPSPTRWTQEVPARCGPTLWTRCQAIHRHSGRSQPPKQPVLRADGRLLQALVAPAGLHANSPGTARQPPDRSGRPGRRALLKAGLAAPAMQQSAAHCQVGVAPQHGAVRHAQTARLNARPPPGTAKQLRHRVARPLPGGPRQTRQARLGR